MKRFLRRNNDLFYLSFRLIVGLMFFAHGAQKVFGYFGGRQVETVVSLMGVVGWIELLAGLMVAVGLLTRVAAFSSMIVMTGAYFKVHAPRAFMPIANGGELALMYFAVFMVLLVFGARYWSVDRYLKKTLN